MNDNGRGCGFQIFGVPIALVLVAARSLRLLFR